MKLYDFYRSSAAYRVRIALGMKGIAAERAFVHLRHGAQRGDDYLAINPHGLVPALVTDEGDVLKQSLAIIEWLDETFPEPPFLPHAPVERARVRAIALGIACDIHPLNNLRVLQYLKGTFGLSEAQRNGWYKYWIDVGFEALDKELAGDRATGTFCHGDTPTLADICLVPQIANARRFEVDLAPYPTLTRIDSACAALPAFDAALPARQPDAE